jgi:hypothetical protein
MTVPPIRVAVEVPVAADRFGSHLIRRACEPSGCGYVAGVSGKLAPSIALQFRRLGAQRSRVPVAAVIFNLASYLARWNLRRRPNVGPAGP